MLLIVFLESFRSTDTMFGCHSVLIDQLLDVCVLNAWVDLSVQKPSARNRAFLRAIEQVLLFYVHCNGAIQWSLKLLALKTSEIYSWLSQAQWDLDSVTSRTELMECHDLPAVLSLVPCGIKQENNNIRMDRSLKYQLHRHICTWTCVKSYFDVFHSSSKV